MEITYTWYGHATHGLKVGEHRLLIDPYFTDNPSAPIKAEETEADFILISHGHGDHLGDTIEIAERTGALCITNFEIANWLAEKGVMPTVSKSAAVFITPLVISN